VTLNNPVLQKSSMCSLLLTTINLLAKFEVLTSPVPKIRWAPKCKKNI